MCKAKPFIYPSQKQRIKNGVHVLEEESYLMTETARSSIPFKMAAPSPNWLRTTSSPLRRSKKSCMPSKGSSADDFPVKGETEV